jgi:hypothetical protein
VYNGYENFLWCLIREASFLQHFRQRIRGMTPTAFCGIFGIWDGNKMNNILHWTWERRFFSIDSCSYFASWQSDLIGQGRFVVLLEMHMRQGEVYFRDEEEG